MSGKQSLFTLPATGMLGQALGWYTIYRMAVWTNNVQCTHGMAFLLRFTFKKDMRPLSLKLNFFMTRRILPKTG
jgi:hypothetical protein